MPAVIVTRPVWRSFRPEYLARAVEHVGAGGHAAVVRGEAVVDALLTVDARGKLTELGLWSLLAIEQQRWRRVKDGVARGLATARIRPDYVDVVLDWCERDAIHPSPTRAVELDCMECAACCHDANVVLGAADIDRWAAAGRRDLFGRRYVRRTREGRLVLRLLDNGRCQHLRRDKACRIYALRHDNCSAFVIGSEACLAAREDTFGLRDG